MVTVRHLAIAVLALLPAQGTSTAQGVAVTQVKIIANGARSDTVSGDETAQACARFRLTPREVARFFATAGRVDERGFNHDLSMSRCHAAGTLSLAKGRVGAKWFIDLARRGSLRFADGQTHYFYCLACTTAKFDEVDDEDRETAKALFKAAHKSR